MAKFYGPVGYAETVETAPGVYVEKITERMYFGDCPVTPGVFSHRKRSMTTSMLRMRSA